MDDYIKIATAAEILGITVQTLYQATWNGKLKYKMVKGIKLTTEKWVQEYKDNRFNREIILFQGKPIFDVDKGRLSVKMVSEILEISVRTVHFFIAKGMLKTTRTGYFHVIARKDMLDFERQIEFHPKFKKYKKAA